MSALETKIEDIISPSINGLGFRLVRVRIQDGGSKRLQILAEKNDYAGISIDDCADISRVVGALMDVENPISGAYELEVSSPGVERPLVKIEDYERFSGRKAKFSLFAPVEGKRKYTARVNKVSGENISLELLDEKQALEIEFNNIASAHLIFDEEEFKKKLNKK